MTAADDLVDVFARSGDACAREGVLPYAFDELAGRLSQRGFSTVSYELTGLAEKIRAGKNGTPVPNPVKPLNPTPKPQPKPEPRQDPPPSKPGGR